MMNTKALASAAFISAFLLSGCIAPRELAYRQVQVIELEDQVNYLKRQLMDAQQGMKKDDSFETSIRNLDADVEWRNGELVIGIKSDLLFKPGSNNLSENDQANLRKIVGLINGKYPNNYLRVEGHTDSDPVVRNADKWDDNWDLSGGRSQAVLKYMIDKCGVNAKRIYFAGFGEHRPKASNSSKAGKARNRRVEIVVIPQQAP